MFGVCVVYLWCVCMYIVCGVCGGYVWCVYVCNVWYLIVYVHVCVICGVCM